VIRNRRLNSSGCSGAGMVLINSSGDPVDTGKNIVPAPERPRAKYDSPVHAIFRVFSKDFGVTIT
jgi:hypothetical protein